MSRTEAQTEIKVQADAAKNVHTSDPEENIDADPGNNIDADPVKKILPQPDSGIQQDMESLKKQIRELAEVIADKTPRGRNSKKRPRSSSSSSSSSCSSCSRSPKQVENFKFEKILC